MQNLKQIIFKYFTVQTKGETCIGIASTYDIDQQMDRITEGALKNSVASWAHKKNLPMYWDHNPNLQIGKWDFISLSSYGLYVRGSINTESKVYTLAKGLIDSGQKIGLSVCIEILKQTNKKLNSGQYIREIEQANLHEISLTQSPANLRANILEIF